MSYEKLKEEKIDASFVYCYPQGVFTKEARRALAQQGVYASVGIGNYGKPQSSIARAAVLSRVPFWEAVGFSKDIFAARLWDLNKLITRSSKPKRNK